jgi:hypothetical protein
MTFCTDPAALPSDAVLSHPDNLPIIMGLAAGADVIIMATGHPPDRLIPHAREVFDHMQRAGHKMLCLGQTIGGWPKHTSRLGYATPFREFKL